MSDSNSTTSIEYRDVIGHPGYRIGSDGSVLSCWLERGHGKMGAVWRQLKPRPSHEGYLRVVLKGKDRTVHQLVAEAFIGPRPTGYQCRHLNGNPADNRTENLAWGTCSENMQDAIRHGTSASLKFKGEANPSAKLTASEVIEIRRLAAERTMSQKRIGALFGVGSEIVHLIHRRKAWSHL